MTDDELIEVAAKRCWQSEVPQWVDGEKGRYYLSADDKNRDDAGVLVEFYSWRRDLCIPKDDPPFENCDPDEAYTLYFEED